MNAKAEVVVLSKPVLENCPPSCLNTTAAPVVLAPVVDSPVILDRILFNAAVAALSQESWAAKVPDLSLAVQHALVAIGALTYWQSVRLLAPLT